MADQWGSLLASRRAPSATLADSAAGVGAGLLGALRCRPGSAAAGYQLDTWQRKAINRALATDAEGILVHRSYLISTARQQGKTALVRALIAWALTAQEGPPWQSIAGVAYDRKQAKLPYRAVMQDLAPLRRKGAELRNHAVSGHPLRHARPAP